MIARRFLVQTLALAIFLFSTGCARRSQTLTWDTKKPVKSYRFLWDNPKDPYLVEFKARYNLNAIVKGAKTDLDKCREITKWVHDHWKHSADNPPMNYDPMYILEKARQGMKLSCLEYSYVTAGCLNSLGVPARVLNMFPSNVENLNMGGVHVVVEAYLRDIKKWILVDSQLDAIPTLDGKPINALQLQMALAKKLPNLSILTKSRTKARRYFKFTEPYLYYFEVFLDNRHDGNSYADRDRRSILLYPVGKARPRSFLGMPWVNAIYTNSVGLFYVKPDLG